jgi:hypothetical protein
MMAALLKNFGPRQAGGFVLLAAMLPLTAIHELAHSVVARALGWRVLEIQVGVGPLIGRFARGETQVEVRLFPLGGYMVPVPTRVAGARLASTLIYLAGPASEALVIGAVALALGPRLWVVGSDYLTVGLQAVAAAAAWGVVGNLLPLVTASGQWTDGLGALLSPFASDAHFERQMTLAEVRLAEPMVATDPAEALARMELILARFPSDVEAWMVAAPALLGLNRREEALLRLRAAAGQASGGARAALEALLAEVRAA